MRLDPESLRHLPLHLQEQIAVALASAAEQPHPVAGQKKVQRVIVRSLRFINEAAVARYGELVKLAEDGIVKDIVMRKNDDGLIDRFLYISEEVFDEDGR